MSKHQFNNIRVPIEEDNVSIYRKEELCVKCGSCLSVCKNNVAVYGNYNLENTDDKAICINCGQCTLVCPTSSICEKKDYLKVREIIKSGKTIIFQTSPAVRVALGEEFEIDLGTNIEGKLVAALRELGATYVFDTTFGADLTIMEEASELIDRIKNKKTMPMFTSCCPAWVKYVETFYPEFIPHLSTCKSPILMQGSLIKDYFAKTSNLEKDNIVNIAVTPCTAKKYEIKRPEFNNDIDYVITTRELAEYIKEEKIDFNSLPESAYDSIMGKGTGAGLIFGNSGGVMEAAIRTAYYFLTGDNPPSKLLNFEEVRGLNNIKEASVTINELTLKIAVVNGTGDARKILDKLDEVDYDFIEVMTCEGGCIAGGGQPRVHFPVTGEVKIKRKDALYQTDNDSKIRNSYQNNDIISIYENYLIKPLNTKSKQLLHTTYTSKKEDLGLEIKQ